VVRGQVVRLLIVLVPWWCGKPARSAS